LRLWLYLAVVILVVAAVWLPGYPAWMTGVIAWAACLLLLPRLPQQQLVMVLVLAGIGALGIAWSMTRGASGLIGMALTQNVPLAGMLIAVSFLQLIAVSSESDAEPLESGRGALFKTMIGVHLVRCGHQFFGGGDLCRPAQRKGQTDHGAGDGPVAGLYRRRGLVAVLRRDGSGADLCAGSAPDTN